MQKALLISVLLTNIAIPIWASRERAPKQGLKKALFAMAIFNAVYLVALLAIYPRL